MWQWNDTDINYLLKKGTQNRDKSQTKNDVGLLDCPASEPLRRAIFGTTSSIFDLWSRPWGVTRLLVSVAFFHAPSLGRGRVAPPPYYVTMACDLLRVEINPSLNFRRCFALAVKREFREKFDFLFSGVPAFFDFFSSPRELGTPCKVALWLEFRKNWVEPVAVGEGMLFQNDAGAIRHEDFSCKKN